MRSRTWWICSRATAVVRAALLRLCSDICKRARSDTSDSDTSGCGEDKPAPRPDEEAADEGPAEEMDGPAEDILAARRLATSAGVMGPSVVAVRDGPLLVAVGTWGGAHMGDACSRMRRSSREQMERSR